MASKLCLSLVPSHLNSMKRGNIPLLFSMPSIAFPTHTSPTRSRSRPFSNSNSHFRRTLCAATTKEKEFSEEKEEKSPAAPHSSGGDNACPKHEYPTGDFEFEEFSAWKSLVVKLRMLVALPWERVRKGSILSMKLRGQISDQVPNRFSSGVSLPQICENFVKAAYDPRISGIYLQVEPLACGWGKVEEIRRHILNFKKSGKFIVGYVPICQEKEYYLGCACGELYVPPSAYVGLYGLTVGASFLGGSTFVSNKLVMANGEAMVIRLAEMAMAVVAAKYIACHLTNCEHRVKYTINHKKFNETLYFSNTKAFKH